MNTNYAADLATAAAHPTVKAAMQGATAALTTLRFHEGLRRRWENARAEAAIREATALALLDGARISVDELRTASMEPATPTKQHEEESLPPHHLLAQGIWRSQWNMASQWEPLNAKGPRQPRQTPPLPARIAALHRDVCSALVRAGLMPTQQVAIPTSPHSIHALTALTGTTIPAIAQAGEVWARLRCQPAFTIGSGAVGAALAREILVNRGIDPSGIAVISMWHTLNPAESADGLEGWKTAQMMDNSAGQARIDALAHWLATFATALEAGAQEGTDIALHIQAGRIK